MGSGDQRSREGQDHSGLAETAQVAPRPVKGSTAAELAPDPKGAVTVTQAGEAVEARDAGSLVGEKLAQFRILALLGQGGMGQVYRALDERLQREVALKVIRAGEASQAGWHARLLREARTAAAVSHKHIASVHEVGEEGEQAFIAMELIEGRTLRNALGAVLPLPEVLRLALQIARGMARAHDKHVLHRDLKPENVMVTSDGDVKILDFGLAKRMGTSDEPMPARPSDEPGATQAGAIMGTPGYMSPEQILGSELDHRSDIFSFGAMLYEMATGTHPFRGNVRRALVDTLNRPPPPPSRHAPRVPPDLDRLVMRCIARKREERVASMHEVVRELERIVASTQAATTWRPPPEGTALPTLKMPEGGSARPRMLPSGVVTLVVAVVAEAALLVEHHGEAYPDILACYHAVFARATERHAGCVVTVAAEQLMAVFADAQQAVEAAIDAQRAFHAEIWPGGAIVSVRMGVHAGEPKLTGDRYTGLDVHRAMRIGESAPGGQVVLSAAARKGMGDGSLDGLMLRDLGSVRIKDLHYPEHLYAVSIDGLPSTRSIVRRLGRPRNVLPAPPTAFIGRGALIADLVALLRRSDVRLVTLTGPGGTGKTRLSIEVAQALQDDFPDGVVQVLLGAVRDPELVLPTIARALDLPEVPGTSTLDVLTNGIGSSSVLLLLDNFEQIVEAAATVADLLGRCSGLKLLVTSRELLRVRGEREHVVPPLELPPAAAGDDFDTIAASEAVRMFVDRARDVSPAFTLTPETAPLVAAICARLDAIELAASRTKMLSLDALHRRLGDRLGFLKATERDREQRHRTLRAAIDWSHDLLDEPQKVLFRRASVFLGGFSVESAEEVCGGSDVDIDVFDGMSSLVAKSLFTLAEVDGAPRLSTLETIREYGQEQLRASPDEALIRARHARHFAAFVEEMAPGVLGRSFRRYVGPLLTESDNIRAALEWAVTQPTPELTVRILKALQLFWMTYGRIAEGRAWSERALAQTQALGQTEARAVVLEVASWLAILSGDIGAVLSHTTEGVAIWKALGREPEGARTKILLGPATAVTGSFPEGLAMVQEACDTCRASGDRFGVALALNVLAELARATGNYVEALARNEEMIAILRELGHVVQVSLFAVNLAYCHLHEGDWARAAEAVTDTLEMGQELMNPFNVAYYVSVMASVAVVRGKPVEGLRLFGAFDTMLRSIGATMQPTDQAEVERYVAAATSALGEDAARAAREEGSRWTRDHAISMTLSLRRP
jgi:predicted ATPase/serine/threonine protein kinase